MIVIKGFSGQPMILLTSLQINSKQKDLWFIIAAYLKRWSIEETIRFLKQIYDLENIRVLKNVRLQNMMALLLAVFYFKAVILDQTQKLTIMAGHVLKCAKRVFGIPDFKYYALGDGLSNIFSKYPGELIKSTEIPDSQLKFGFGKILEKFQYFNLNKNPSTQDLTQTDGICYNIKGAYPNTWLGNGGLKYLDKPKSFYLIIKGTIKEINPVINTTRMKRLYLVL
jgi:hypothetical protein